MSTSFDRIHATRGGTSFRPVRERLESKLDQSGDCWLFTGAVGPDGYGRIGVGEGIALAHRVAYEVFVGPIPDGLHIDHLCRSRRCCNPAHLEAVTQRENNVRMQKANRATRCKRGHEFTPENTMTQKDGRFRLCRTCHNMTSKAARRGLTVETLARLLEGGPDEVTF